MICLLDFQSEYNGLEALAAVGETWLSVSAQEPPPHPPDFLALPLSVNRPERELKEIVSLCATPLCNSREINIKQKAEWLCFFSSLQS